MPAKIIWNDDLDAALRDLIASGANREVVEDAMGISWPTCRKRLRELGVAITPSRETRPATLRAVALVRAGYSRPEAARIARVNPDTLRGALRRMARDG